MPFPEELRINFSNQKTEYDLRLVIGEESKHSVKINGKSYAVLGKEEHLDTACKILNSISLEDLLGAEDLRERLSMRSDLSFPKMQTIDNIGKNVLKLEKSTESQILQKERQMRVEKSLIPLIPIRGSAPRSIEERMKELNVPGASVAVIHKGIIDWVSGYGELSKPVLIQGASISKTVTALTVLSLIDESAKALQEGRKSGLKNDLIITLKTDVSTLLDEELWKSIDPKGMLSFRNPKMTIEELLSHTAGTSVSGFNGYPQLEVIEKEIEEITEMLKNPKHPDPEKLKMRLKELNASRKPPNVDGILKGEGNSDRVQVVQMPGTDFEYSGGGTTILQKVIEEITGQDFDKVVEKQVFKKLKMDDSCYHPKNTPTCHGNDVKGKPTQGAYHIYPELAAAGLWTTPLDLAKMTIGIQNSMNSKEEGILSVAAAKQMLTPRTTGKPNGLGIFVENTSSTQYFFHNGANEGFRCMFVANGKEQGAVVMTNSNNGQDLYKELFLSIAEVYEWPDHKNLPMFQSLLAPDELKALENPVGIEKWGESIGKYHFAEHVVEVSIKEGKIWVQTDQDPPFELIPVTENAGLYRLSDPGPFNVIRLQKQGNSVLSLELFGEKHTKK